MSILTKSVEIKYYELRSIRNPERWKAANKTSKDVEARYQIRLQLQKLLPSTQFFYADDCQIVFATVKPELAILEGVILCYNKMLFGEDTLIADILHGRVIVRQSDTDKYWQSVQGKWIRTRNRKAKGSSTSNHLIEALERGKARVQESNEILEEIRQRKSLLAPDYAEVEIRLMVLLPESEGQLPVLMDLYQSQKRMQ